MAEEASIVLKLSDQTSAGFSSAKRSASELEKEYATLAQKIGDLQTKNKALNESYASLQTKLVDAKKAVQDATKAYKESADEADRIKLTKAQEEYKTLTDQLYEFKTASADTRKEIRELQDTMRRMDDGAGSGSGSGSSGGSAALSGWSAGLAAMGKQISGAASGFASYYLSSSLGSTDATMASGIISGIMSGASAGLLTGNPFGVAIGAAVGGVSGLISGITAKSEQEDDVFKSYRDELVSSVTEGIDNSLSSGSSVAAQREQDMISFTTLIGEDRAASLLDRIKDLSNLTPYLYDDLTGIAKTLATFGSTSDQIYGRLKTIGNTGAALGLSSAEMRDLASLLGKIGDNEKFTSEFKQSLIGKKINASALLEDYYGITSSEADSMLAKMSGNEAMNAIMSALQQRYAGSMEAQSHTYAGALSTYEGLIQNRDAAMGEAYNAARMSGLDSQNTWLNQEDTKQAFQMIGTALAQKENYEASIEQAVMGGIFGDGTQDLSVLDEETASIVADLRDQYMADIADYQTADEQTQMEIGADIYRIYGEAQAAASSAADAAEKLDAWDEASITLVENTGSIVEILGAHGDLLRQQIAATRGLAAYRTSTQWAEGSSNLTESGGVYVGAGARSAYGTSLSMADIPRRRASGQRVIPYNDFPILAHEGEMLLTAAEAREYHSRSSSVLVSGNTFVVRQDSDIDAIAEAIARRFTGAARIMAG